MKKKINCTKLRRNLYSIGIFSLVLSFFCGCGVSKKENPPAVEVEPELRAVWVSVLGPGLKSPQEIRQLVDAVRRANLNTIVAQVHREGAAMFHSTLEPRHASILERPDFDPLATLLKDARDTSGGKALLAVHAWFNTFKIGEQKDYLDSTPRPIAIAHPDWYTRDREGEIQYELDPSVPAVQDHMIAVIEECLRNYDVDGINLDFVRYFGVDRGYHPLALKRFYQNTGTIGRPAVDDEVWSDFRRNQVSDFVKRCAISVWTYRPNAIFSTDATGWGPAPIKHFSETRPYGEVFQDWSGWSERGWLDLVLRMGYKREWVGVQAKDFRDWADYTNELIGKSDGRMVTVGIGGHFNPMKNMLTQYQEAQTRGLGTCLFSYDRPTQEASDSDSEVRGFRSPVWDAIGKEIYPNQVPPPLPHWRIQRSFIAGFLKDESGKPIAGGKVALAGTNYNVKSDGAGFFAFYALPPGSYQLSAFGDTIDGKKVNALAGEVTWVK
ncbi:MAG: family 10 glycosylhydrolase [Verrucomicrobia bacterium]|nr:family 10 glycosylhydrolase [Verrucomicrobiota bacterium]